MDPEAQAEQEPGGPARDRSAATSWLLLRLVVAYALSGVVGTSCSIVAYGLVEEPYPPVGWEEAAFRGVVVGEIRPNPSRKARWVVVITPEGRPVTMPREVHDGIPRVGQRVRKEAGRIEFGVTLSKHERGPWEAITPEEEPGAGFLLGFALFLGCNAAFITLASGLVVWRWRRRFVRARLARE